MPGPGCAVVITISEGDVGDGSGISSTTAVGARNKLKRFQEAQPGLQKKVEELFSQSKYTKLGVEATSLAKLRGQAARWQTNVTQAHGKYLCETEGCGKCASQKAIFGARKDTWGGPSVETMAMLKAAHAGGAPGTTYTRVCAGCALGWKGAAARAPALGSVVSVAACALSQRRCLLHRDLPERQTHVLRHVFASAGQAWTARCQSKHLVQWLRAARGNLCGNMQKKSM